MSYAISVVISLVLLGVYIWIEVASDKREGKDSEFKVGDMSWAIVACFIPILNIISGVIRLGDCNKKIVLSKKDLKVKNKSN